MMITGVATAAIALAAAGAFERPQSATLSHRNVVSAGCAPPNGKTVAYVWHASTIPAPEGDRFFKELAAPDFEDCLSESARTRKYPFPALIQPGP